MLLLFNPSAKIAVPTLKDRPPFLILLDASRSMNTADAPNGSTRWQTAKRLTLENRPLLDALTERYAVRFAAFDRRLQPKTVSALRQISAPNGDQTALAEALRQARAIAGGGSTGQNSVRGGLLLVSDGRDNGSGSPVDAAKELRAAGLPVYTFCVGTSEQNRDISLTAQRPQTWAAPDQAVELVATLRDVGIPRTQAQIDLIRDGRIVQSKFTMIQPGAQDITFTVREANPGAYRYVIACRPVSGETNPANNRANLFLNALQNRAKILLLEGVPTWDAKFLAQTLRDDPTIALDAIYQLSDSRRFALGADSTRPDLRVPRTLADFAAYDAVLIEKGFDGFFDADAANALKQWISARGGNLVLLRGRADERSDVLRELSPVVFGPDEIADVHARLTEAGRDYPGFQFSGGLDAQTTIQRLPSLISATQTEGEKALTVILARAGNGEPAGDANAPEVALLAYGRYGQGKVMAIAGEGIWRWAFLPPEQAPYNRVYADFWTQTVRWLLSESDFLPGQNFSLKTDRDAYALTDAVNLLGYARSAKPTSPPAITLTLPDGKQTQIIAALSKGGAADFTATFRPALPGDYLATLHASDASGKSAPVRAAFTVYPGQQEDANRAANPELMRQIAAAGGGQAVSAAELPALAETLRAAELAARPKTDNRALWDKGFVLAALLALYFVPLFIKRR